MEPQESSSNKILTISLVVLIIITIGLGGYALLSISQKKTVPKTTPAVIMVTPTITPTVETDNPNNIDVGSIEADLKDIGVDVNSLQ